ncbi:MAG TPA: sigma-E processing peptidase SpoIIGA [Bacilli bacterium]|nr:sigma-E processing peptidase SpoIIGA [Bacilli bacterium]
MKVYIDYLFLINFLFDFIILVSLSSILKRNVKIYRIILGSVFGGISIIILFINLPSFIFFILKMLSGIIMVIITFNFKSIKYTINNFINLLAISVILGGSLYLLNINDGDYNFINGNKYLNMLFLFAISIIILFIYIKINKKYKRDFNNIYEVDLFIDNNKYKCTGFIDTGNVLIDPYFNKPIILTSNKNVKFNNTFFVPYQSLNNNGLLECMIVKKIYIKQVGYRYNIVLGRANDKFRIDGIDILLNERIVEK